eukprot:ctg_1128.g458
MHPPTAEHEQLIAEIERPFEGGRRAPLSSPSQRSAGVASRRRRFRPASGVLTDGGEDRSAFAVEHLEDEGIGETAAPLSETLPLPPPSPSPLPSTFQTYPRVIICRTPPAARGGVGTMVPVEQCVQWDRRFLVYIERLPAASFAPASSAKGDAASVAPPPQPLRFNPERLYRMMCEALQYNVIECGRFPSKVAASTALHPSPSDDFRDWFRVRQLCPHDWTQLTAWQRRLKWTARTGGGAAFRLQSTFGFTFSRVLRAGEPHHARRARPLQHLRRHGPHPRLNVRGESEWRCGRGGSAGTVPSAVFPWKTISSCSSSECIPHPSRTILHLSQSIHLDSVAGAHEHIPLLFAADGGRHGGLGSGAACPRLRQLALHRLVVGVYGRGKLQILHGVLMAAKHQRVQRQRCQLAHGLQHLFTGALEEAPAPAHEQCVAGERHSRCIGGGVSVAHVVTHVAAGVARRGQHPHLQRALADLEHVAIPHRMRARGDILRGAAIHRQRGNTARQLSVAARVIPVFVRGKHVRGRQDVESSLQLPEERRRIRRIHRHHHRVAAVGVPQHVAIVVLKQRYPIDVQSRSRHSHRLARNAPRGDHAEGAGLLEWCGVASEPRGQWRTSRQNPLRVDPTVDPPQLPRPTYHLGQYKGGSVGVSAHANYRRQCAERYEKVGRRTRRLTGGTGQQHGDELSTRTECGVARVARLPSNSSRTPPCDTIDSPGHRAERVGRSASPICRLDVGIDKRSSPPPCSYIVPRVDGGCTIRTALIERDGTGGMTPAKTVS